MDTEVRCEAKGCGARTGVNDGLRTLARVGETAECNWCAPRAAMRPELTGELANDADEDPSGKHGPNGTGGEISPEGVG